LLLPSPIRISTGTLLFAGISTGILALIWYTPTKPGASPENNTSAETPPINTEGVLSVLLNGEVPAA
jgi:hypothetical protein